MPSNESDAHKNLKRLALQWAAGQGYRSGGCEINLPHCGYRADVAVYRPDSEVQAVEFEGKSIRQRQAVLGSTAVFECKQSRADLFKDSCLLTKARDSLARLQARRLVIEKLLRLHFPAGHLGDTLFQEFDSFDFAATGHKGHARILQKIQALQTALLEKNKFEKLVRYRCANLFYLVTVEDIVEDYELPLSWGLLVQSGDALRLVQKPAWVEASEGARLAILQRIAASNHPLRAERKKWNADLPSLP